MIKSRGRRHFMLLMLLFFLGTPELFAQGRLLYYNKVDTLKVIERFNLRANIVDWLVLTPNVGVEFATGNKNWNTWTVGLYGRFNWHADTKVRPYYVYDLYDGRVELRKYWHAHMPKRVFYVGAYAGANKFDIKLGSVGRKGQGVFGGLMVGTITQLYGYQNGASLDLDLGVNAGVVFAKYHEYRREFAGNQYVYTVTKPESGYALTFSPWIYAASTDIIKASLVYHFGTKLSNKYKNRMLVDTDYRIALDAQKMRMDSINTALEKQRRLKADSLEKVDYEKRFEKQHLEIERKYQADSLKKVNEALHIEALKAKAEAKKVADSLKVVEREKAVEAARQKQIDRENAKRVADSLKVVEREKAVAAAQQKQLDRENAKRVADSLKVVEREKAAEAAQQKQLDREKAKREADSLKTVRKSQEAEAALMKEQDRERAKRERDSLAQVKQTQKQEALKAKEEEKKLKKQKKDEEKSKSKKKDEEEPQATNTAGKEENAGDSETGTSGEEENKDVNKES